ncbi:hypothetical protein T492DRAFT_501219 [Pavlovales sp. CCMP2436]|nr:hypothetical protein T492DRAFT_501219 [Pavlovales sp. CCMP2436]
MLPAVATPLWRANCPHCTRQLHFKAAPGASPIVVCGACGQRFEAETTPGGAPPQPRSNGHRAPEQSALSEAEELDIAIAISLSDGAPSPTPRAKLVQGADDFWKCPLCVCCNSRTVNRCVCGHERQRARGCAPAPHHAPSAREMPRPARVCPACTFESPSGSAVCSMCGQAFGNGSAPATQGVRAQPPSQPLSQPPLGREAVAEEGSFALLSVDERQATQEKESRALLRQIEAFCTKQRCSFVDDSFFPSDRSVYLDGRNWSRGDVQERPAERSADARVTQWLRPAEIARRGTNPFDLFEQTSSRARWATAGFSPPSQSSPNARCSCARSSPPAARSRPRGPTPCACAWTASGG